MNGSEALRNKLARDVNVAIQEGNVFFKEHPALFPDKGQCDPEALQGEDVQRLNEIRRRINMGIKNMVALNGRIPPVLIGGTRILEKTGLLLNRNRGEFYTHYQTLGRGQFEENDEESNLIKLQGWGAFRSALTWRWVENREIKSGLPVGLNDGLRVLFTLKNRQVLDGILKNHPDICDFGWSLNVTHDQARDELMTDKKREGLPRRLHRFEEWAKNGTRKTERSLAVPDLSNLTFMSEWRKDNGDDPAIIEKRLCLLDGKLSFGDIDVTKTPPDMDEINRVIAESVECSRQKIISCLIAELRGENPAYVRGARPGTNPTSLYR